MDAGGRVTPGAVTETAYLSDRQPDVLVSGGRFFNLIALWARRRAAATTKVVVTERSTLSVNIAIMNFAFDAVNAAYQVVIPRDAVAGFPREYVEAAFQNTLGAIATLTTTDELLGHWR